MEFYSKVLVVNPKEMADVEMAAVPGVSSDAELILKLQEKLTTLKGQIHTWKARSKGECQIQIQVSFLMCVNYVSRFGPEQQLQL